MTRSRSDSAGVVNGTVLAARGLLPQGHGGEGLDLALEPGTVCCIVGPPHTGKSAWLRALAGIEPPAQGRLTLAGEDVAALDARQWRFLRRRVAYIGANPALLSVLRANDNVTVAAHYHRIADGAQIRAKAQGLLDRLGWHGALDVLPAYLDGRQKLLLALARCLILDPLILFLHEPFRMIDVAAGRGFGAMLAGLARDGGAAQVIVTQQLAFVRRWASRILFTGRGGLSVHDGWGAFAAAPDPEIRDYLQVVGEGGES